MQPGAAITGGWPYRYVPSICAALVFLGFVLLWRFDLPLHLALLRIYIWTAPSPTPFYDLGAVLRAGACWRQGVDVYLPSACMQGGSYNYSPALLRIGWLGLGQGAQLWGGVALSLGCIAACALLPPALTRGELLLRCLLLCSAAAAHAFECGNIDLAMFILVAGGVALQRGNSAARLAGYALFLLGGALKFYPAVVLALLLRETRARLLCAGAGLILVAALLLWRHWQVLSVVFGALPLGLPFRGSFGAVDLPFGLVLLAGMHRPSVVPAGPVFAAALHQPHLVVYVVFLSKLLVLAGLLAGLRLAPRHAAALAALDEARRLFLVAGALLLALCFFLAPNYEYRGLLLLLTVPGLYAMAAVGHRRCALLLALLPLLLWERVLWEVFGGIGALLPGQALASILGIALWLVREAGWWFIIIQLTAIAAAYTSAMLRHLSADTGMLFRYPAGGSRQMSKAIPRAIAAFALYAAIAAIVMVHGASLTHELSGTGSDPYDSPWFLAWWPYALTHHLDPFFTKLIWYPSGVSLLWITAVPLLSLLGWPLTAVYGPALTYNLLIVTSPVFCAWSAYFLCRHVTRDFTASFIGGFIFGFSTYETAQSFGALNLTIVYLVPLLLLVVLKRLDGALSRPQAVALAALLLLAQFLICIEIFAMIFVFGGLAWALALLYLPQHRAVLKRLLVDGLYTAPFVALPLLPLFIAMAPHYALINHPAAWPYIWVTDLLSILLPSQLNLFGHSFHFLQHSISGSSQENGGYLGLPLLVILTLFAWGQGRTPRGRYCSVLFLLCLFCSFGPFLWVNGHFTGIPMPWLAVVHLPLLGSALPARFTMFASLAAAIITALWLAQPGRRAARLAFGLLACVALLPQPHPWRPLPDAKFFAPGRVQQVLGPNPRLLLLPFAINGPSSYWQMQNHFGFTQVGGYLGFPPKPAQSYKAVMELFGDKMGKTLNPEDFAVYARAAGAAYVVAGPGADPAELAAIATLGWPARQVDDVTIFTVPYP